MQVILYDVSYIHQLRRYHELATRLAASWFDIYTCIVAQLVEHCSGIEEVMGSNFEQA